MKQIKRTPDEWKRLANCKECQLNGRPFVPPYIDLKVVQYRTLWLGQEPGDNERYTGIPFTGDAGKQHYAMLKSAGLSKTLLPHDNICSCFPPEEWKPNAFDSACCLPRLRVVIHTLQPKLIIALGDVAMNALTGKSGIQSCRGQFFPLLGKYEYECEVYCVLHPSFCQRARQWIPVQIELYKEVHKYFSESKTSRQRRPHTFLNDPDAESLQKMLYEHDDVIDCDTETTGLNPRQDIPLGHSFSTEDDLAIALYYQQPYETDPRWPVVKKFFEDPTRRKCWQNGSFDTAFCREHGIHDQGFVYDTRLGQQLLNSDLPTDLDFLRAQYTTIPPYKPPKQKIAKIRHWARDEMLEYANWDALTLREVRQAQQSNLSEGQMKVMQELLIPLVRAINRMESRGCLVDVDALAGMYSRIAPELERMSKPFDKIGLNPRSPKQLMSYFGLKSTDKKVIQKQIDRRHKHAELMKLLLDYRSLQRNASTYLKGVYKRLEAGRIHTHFKIEGTGTGRLSSENPNLQNVPDEMRVIYIADPGHVLIKGDYSQIELWVGAILIYLLTGCDAMLRDLYDGVDVHYEAAKMCFPHVKCTHGVRSEDFTHRQSNIAKTVVFGTFYGRTAWSIATAFAVSVAEAESWQLKLINRYPGTAKYKSFCEDAYNRKGYLDTPFGRRRYLTSIKQGYNFPIQSTASDITLKSIVLNDQAGLWNWVTVHDDIVIQTTLENEDKDLKTFRSILERKVPELEGISFKVGYSRGTDWYNMEEKEV